MEQKEKKLKVATIYREYRERFKLNLLTGEKTLESLIINAEVSRPGLILAGFSKRFAWDRTQVMGETEVVYMQSLKRPELKKFLDRMCGFEIPCIFVTKGLKPPPVLLEVAERHGRPVLGTSLGTQEFTRRFSTFLETHFAPHEYLHGSLADVYGVGLLYTGPSGIGKSECVLDLVERGHRLVCDDVVHIIREGDETLVGIANDKVGHHMEIRGLGIIDVFRLFGIRAVRKRKRIEVVVELVHWDDRADIDRTGLSDNTTEILAVELPLVRVPLVPGKNITVISEVIATNHLLKLKGYNSAQEFNRRLLEQMQPVDYIDEVSE
ncbi:MAG: HPr(Ser) kinase/phosphatase [Candidatus Glassbacteria bacterium]|nr:HPr(Ser) kinase/phosphatase [Candidatus Glassbacteria bacterium]